MHLKKSVKSPMPDALDAVNALKQLNEIDRVIAGLYFYEGLTINQIAEVVDEVVPVVRDSLRNIFSSLLPEDHDDVAVDVDKNFAVTQTLVD